MDNNNTEISIEELLNSMKCVHARLVEKMKTFENRELIIRDMLVVLPEYQNLISSNIALKEEIVKLKTVSFDRAEGVQIAITEKNNNKDIPDLYSLHYELNNPFLDEKLLTIISIWRDKLYYFVETTDAKAPNIDAINLLKDAFNESFSCYLNRVVSADSITYNKCDLENVNNLLNANESSINMNMKSSIDVSDEDENDHHNCSDTEEMLDSDTANEFE